MMIREAVTIFEEKSIIVRQQQFEENQYILTLKAPKASQKALPGEFAFIDCGKQVFLRRPLSYLRTNAENQWVEFLYRIVGPGLKALSQLQPGDEVDLMGPIGNGFRYDKTHQIPVLIGGGVGIPPVLFLAEYLKSLNQGHSPVAFFGSETPFPFSVIKSSMSIDGIENGASIIDMEEKNIPCRLASLSGLEGCHKSFVTDLADQWIKTLDQKDLSKVAIYACGPEPMLRSTAKLARSYGVDCQISLEEFMACATGGCAGCTVKVSLPEGKIMKRVCVDGPVFDAQMIYPDD